MPDWHLFFMVVGTRGFIPIRSAFLPYSLAFAFSVSTAWGCTGVAGEPGFRAGDPEGPPPLSTCECAGEPACECAEAPPAGQMAWSTGPRRLTRAEYQSSVALLLGIEPSSDLLARLPVDLDNPDNNNPFTNDESAQAVSSALIEALDSVSFELASLAVGDSANPAARDELVDCVPTGPGDEICFRSFVERVGRQAFRRPLSDEEIEPYLALQAFSTRDDEVQRPDFYSGLELVVAAFLSDPRFLYPLEIGLPVVGDNTMVRLTSFEVATRMSLMLLGSTPDAELINAAEAGELETLEGRVEHANRMLSLAQAKERILGMHAAWLGYADLEQDRELAERLVTETQTLVERVLFDEPASWNTLLTSRETYIDGYLADHYGLVSSSAEFTWVSYGDSGRQGIFSQGAILSNGRKFNDTSVVNRGLFVRERVLCQEIGDPPPEVNVDDPPERTEEAPCKQEQAEQRRNGACETCHAILDPIGFGLEQYDGDGRYRTFEPEHPECVIDGEGEIYGVGAFNGPRGLSDLLADSPELDSCVVSQAYRFASGHQEGAADRDFLISLVEQYVANGRRFDQLVLELATSEAILYRTLSNPTAGDE